MNACRKLAAGAIAALLSTASAAEVTLYGQEGYRGRAVTFDRAFPDLEQSRLDDRASSLTVRSGTWELCSESYYRGHCVILPPGDYPTLRLIGLDNAVSSLREAVPPGERRVLAAPTGRGVVLYEGPQFSGRSLAVETTLDSLAQHNDWARSMIIYDGQWELCQHDRFRGDCARYGPGRYETLGRLAGDVSSMRLIDRVVAAPVPAPAVSRVVLYEGSNFRGRAVAIEEDLMTNLYAAGVDNRASSLRVDGGAWVVCNDANFQGQCWTFGPGEYPVLPAALNDRVSSARRVADAPAAYDREPRRR